ncbi:MAG TPA: hypothetical protein VGC54_03575 [Planctomycetota bacterium]
MKRFVPTLAVLCLCLLPLACGGDTNESIAKENVSLMSEFVGTLEGITDKASAEAAKGELDSLVEKLNELKARMVKMGEPSAAEKAKLMADSDMAAVQLKLQSQMMRLMADREVGAVLADSFSSLSGK